VKPVPITERPSRRYWLRDVRARSNTSSDETCGAERREEQECYIAAGTDAVTRTRPGTKSGP
jgi:hypothetical protein